MMMCEMEWNVVGVILQDASQLDLAIRDGKALLGRLRLLRHALLLLAWWPIRSWYWGRSTTGFLALIEMSLA